MGMYSETRSGADGADFTEVVAYAPPSWLQLIMRVADGSQSMTWALDEPDTTMEGVAAARTKAEAVDMATRDLVNRVAGGRNGANFMYASVSFNDRVTEERSPRPLLEVPGSEDFDPTSAGIGGTRIWLGLEAAARIVEDFQRKESGDIQVSTVVLVESDGECEDPDATVAAAKRLHALPNTHIAACLFATKGQEPVGAPLLQAIVTDRKLFQTVFTAEQLRRFFHDSVTTIAQRALPAGS
jgi:hypothetical protein